MPGFGPYQRVLVFTIQVRLTAKQAMNTLLVIEYDNIFYFMINVDNTDDGTIWKLKFLMELKVDKKNIN